VLCQCNLFASFHVGAEYMFMVGCVCVFFFSKLVLFWVVYHNSTFYVKAEPVFAVAWF
jgi:hypothetical protein